MTAISILCLFCSIITNFPKMCILQIVRSYLFFLFSLEGRVTWLLNGLKVKVKNKSNMVIFRALYRHKNTALNCDLRLCTAQTHIRRQSLLRQGHWHWASADRSSVTKDDLNALGPQPVAAGIFFK